MSYFNVRVYGIMINDDEQVLLSDEYIRGNYFTKFPGGGLEFGEGLLDCIRREWKEELAQDIEVIKHLYTTDFFQISAFDNHSQIISIYYVVKPVSPYTFPVIINPFDFEVPEGITQVEAARWIHWDYFSEDCVTLPIDKVVARIMKEQGIAGLIKK